MSKNIGLERVRLVGMNGIERPACGTMWRPVANDLANSAMPIYEFECPSCAHRFERLQKVADIDPSDCPECAKSGVRRRLTAPAFRLSGSGWYETDFKKDGDVKRNLTSAESSPAKASEDSAPIKSDGAKNELTKAETPKTEQPKRESKPSGSVDS